MKNFVCLVVFLIIIALQLNCGLLPPQTQPDPELPLDTKLSLLGYCINKNQELFLALYDPIDSINYTSLKIKPDSIICVIDDNNQTPTLRINKIHVVRVELRYNSYPEHRKDYSQNNSQRPNEPPITITYLESIRIFRFIFSSKKEYKSILPKELRDKAYLIILNPPKLKFKPDDGRARRV